MYEVLVVPRSVDALVPYVRPSHLARFRSTCDSSRRALHGRTLWHVNSTADGGGVAELLHQVLGYVTATDIDCRWIVIEGDEEFFRITKRIHNHLHGVPGDGGVLRGVERAAYMRVLQRELPGLRERVQPNDVVVLHDPQTAGLITPLVEAGSIVVWVCHVGVDRPNDLVRDAWRFLREDVRAADALVFSRRQYIWEGLGHERIAVIPPCIDPTSPKNIELATADIATTLRAAGVVAEVLRAPARPDGAIEVRRRAEVVEEGPVPADRPLVVQISRWDRLKDHVHVAEAFARHVSPRLDAHLLLVGPMAASVTDDPEGGLVLQENIDGWQRLDPAARRRIHIASLPVDDRIENATVVNALQRRADVVVQKSLAEGFGLTVAEAMWKRTPVVGSRVGGIREQIVDGRSGLLVDPTDVAALGHAVSSLLRDPGFAQAIGHAGRDRIRGRFLPPHFLGRHLALIEDVLASGEIGGAARAGR